MQSVDVLLSYPWWTLVLSILLSAGISYLLYTRNYFDTEDSRSLRIGLMTLRTLFIGMLLFLLLGPLLKSNIQEIEKPTLVLAMDQSASVLANTDSSSLVSFYNETVREAEKALGSSVTIEVLGFGSKTKESINDPSDQSTNISDVLQDIDDQYENRNLGAVVLVSDGIYNQGPNPEYLNRRTKSPIYSLGLGDTTVKRDLILEEVRTNDIAFLGNEYPVKISWAGQKLGAEKTVLTIRDGNNELFRKELQLEPGNTAQSTTVYLEAKVPGIQKLSISLSPIEREATLLNNAKLVFVEVMDARNKVLIQALSPHPDISAIKQAIESNKNYEVQVQYAFQKASIDLTGIDLLILHRLPQYEHPLTQVLEKTRDQNIPVLFFVDPSVYPQALARAVPEFGFQSRRGEVNEILPKWNDKFSLFELSEETQTALLDMPPIFSPYGRYPTIPDNRVLAFQQIGSVATDQPLLAFSENGSSKAGIFFGTGFWRWRLYDFEKNETHQATNEFINRAVQYLSVRENRSPFRVKATAKTYFENEPLQFEAQLYNASFQLITEPDVQLTLKDEEGNEFPFTMGRGLSQYSLDAGYFKPGQYSYIATTNYQGKVLKQSGIVVVKPLQLESLNTTARHDLLKRLARKSGGQFFPQAASGDLWKSLENASQFKSVSYYKSSFLSFIELKWFFWVLLAFISSEWVIRKIKGAY